MMRQLGARIKPKSGFSHILHLALTCLLPALMFVFVRIRFYQIAAALIVLSKWRMFAVKPRHWPANLRANAIDITVGLAALVFMVHSGSQLWQFIWAVVYGVWLLWLKPQSSVVGVSLQALLGELVGLVALFIAWGTTPGYVLVLAAWVICYSSARHFFTNFEEGLTRYLSYAWAYFAAALVWVTSHWLIFYGQLAQPALLLSVLSFGLGGMYYLQKTERMTVLLRRQLIFIMVAIVVIMLTFSQWGDKTI